MNQADLWDTRPKTAGGAPQPPPIPRGSSLLVLGEVGAASQCKPGGSGLRPPPQGEPPCDSHDGSWTAEGLPQGWPEPHVQTAVTNRASNLACSVRCIYVPLMPSRCNPVSHVRPFQTFTLLVSHSCSMKSFLRARWAEHRRLITSSKEKPVYHHLKYLSSSAFSLHSEPGHAHNEAAWNPFSPSKAAA